MLWSTIYNHLKSEGFDVYSPGQHKGACVSPYVVVRPSGTNQFNEYSTDIMYYDVLCYVPVDKFSLLEPYVDQIKCSMRKLYPQLKESHMEVQGFIDDTNDSNMWSVQYESYRQFKNNFSL